MCCQGEGAARLRYPSIARSASIVAIDKTLIQRVLGAVPADEIEWDGEALRQAFALQARQTAWPGG
jgi:hypothetical protein